VVDRAEEMWAVDTASGRLGIELEELGDAELRGHCRTVSGV
jgi:hypothetical protein